VPYRGLVSDFIHKFLGGIKSGFSYCGAHTIAELWKNAEFIRITQSSLRESGAHDVDVM